MELQFHEMPASKQSTNLYDIYLMLCVQSWTPDDGREDRPKHVEGTHLVPASMQSTNLYDIYLMLYVQSWTPDDGQKNRPKHVEW